MGSGKNGAIVTDLGVIGLAGRPKWRTTGTMSVMVTSSPADVRAILDSLGFDPFTMEANAPCPDAPSSDAGIAPSDGQAHQQTHHRALPHTAVETRPDTLLSSLLSLEGAVNVGDMLERVGDLEAAPPDAQQLLTHRQIMLTLTKRRFTIGKRIEQRYAQAFEGVRPAPSAQPIFNLLSESGVLESRKPKLLAECAHKIADRYHFLFSSTLGVTRKELYWLREDALKALQRVSPRGKRIVMLDNVLDGAVEQAALQAHRSLEAGVAQRFAQQLVEAMLALPEPAQLPSIETWFKRRGFITRFVHDCKRLTWAILDSEWSRLRGLCDACCATCAADNPLPSEALQAAGIPASPAANTSLPGQATPPAGFAPLYAPHQKGLAP